jgi:hypothetical protein
LKKETEHIRKRYNIAEGNGTNVTSVQTRGNVKAKDKAIPVTGRRGPYVYETSRHPHFLESGLTDGGEVSLTRPGTNFCWRLSQLHGHSGAGRIRSVLKKIQ